MQQHDGPVGYGRPPKETRFQPGTSGNPAGRPKGRRNLAADLRDELVELVKVVEDGHEAMVSKQRAVVKALVAGSIKGDLRAIATLLHVLGRQGDEISDPEDDITDEDRDILESFADREKATEMASADPKPSLALPAPSGRGRGSDDG